MKSSDLQAGLRRAAFPTPRGARDDRAHIGPPWSKRLPKKDDDGSGSESGGERKRPAPGYSAPDSDSESDPLRREIGALKDEIEMMKNRSSVALLGGIDKLRQGLREPNRAHQADREQKPTDSETTS